MPPMLSPSSSRQERFWDRLGQHSVLAFFSTKVLRGGPKILIYLAACLSVFILVIRFMPHGLSAAALGLGTTQNIWHWSTNESNKSNDAYFDYDYGSREESGLRVVVFGEDDIATPTWVEREGGAKSETWSQILCRELRCSDYLSFVPRPEHPSHALVSNGLYAAAVDHLLQETAESQSPGSNYRFQPEKYPIPWGVPDLSSQVDAFLAMDNRSVRPPKETLWVFTLGTWDVWSLATIPLNTSRPVVELMTTRVFEQAERLYQSALKEGSAAWSGVVRNGEQNGTSARMFRVLVPFLFDPSLSPGWTTRPKLSAVHSKAEQMRNAATLTDDWNVKLGQKLVEWVRRGVDPTERGDGSDDNSNTPMISKRTMGNRISEIMPSRQRKEELLCDGFAYDMGGYVLDEMLENQLHKSGIHDSNGLGIMAESQIFRDVRKPCVSDNQSPLCETPGDHLFFTPFIVAPRAVGEMGRQAAEMVRNNTSVRSNWDSIAKSLRPKS
ncbi:hypothetical protein B0H63DRAFT_467764 [Podospora didyma]|uniref:Uncharacterized protein n=1 Tax=Podospora didyma TaxID=330526 RepID=A0AAE0NRN4_9PEZI|nr:hypothetical protein B0H63DRAFT_467764 [Podospora didyma]